MGTGDTVHDVPERRWGPEQTKEAPQIGVIQMAIFSWDIDVPLFKSSVKLNWALLLLLGWSNILLLYNYIIGLAQSLNDFYHVHFKHSL